MDWEDAKAWELENWRAIRGAVGTMEPTALRTWMNRAGEFCRLARLVAVAHGETEVCPRCPACQQFGGCQDVRRVVYEALVVGRTDEARRVLDEFLDHLVRLEIPEELALAPG